jgi:folate-binding Fe-S cluster repair protein YgfZ
VFSLFSRRLCVSAVNPVLGTFTKGCYLGQEIVERIRAQDRVNKKLERLELAGIDPPAPGTKLQVEGRDAEITSAVYSPHFGTVIALAYVRTA